MGKAMEVIDTYHTATAAETALVAVTAYSGDVLTVRNFPDANRAWLGDLWTVAATDGIARVRSPLLHDNVQGLRFRMDGATGARDLLTEYDRQQLHAQDALILEIQSGATETDGLSYLNYYEDLPGADARLSNIDALLPRIVNLVNVEVACASAAVIGNRCTSVAMNATFDLLRANTDYAVLGYEVDVVGQSIGIRGPDTGNLRIGGPATVERMETRDWFVRLGKRLGVDTIPIINSANKSGTLIDNCQVVTGVAMNVTLVMAQLSA